MYALVVVACLASQPDACRADVHAERWPLQIGCAVAAPQAAAGFEAVNPGWRVRRTLCVPTPHLHEVLARLNGEDV